MPKFTQQIIEQHNDVELTITVEATGPDDRAASVHRQRVAELRDSAKPQHQRVRPVETKD